MKRVYITISLFLGILCFSCENNVKVDNKTTDKEIVKKNNKAKEIRQPDTIIDGVRIYNFKNEPTKVKEKEVNLDEAINLFDRGVNEANTCNDLIKACANFDSNVKKLSQKDSSIKVTDIEKREDVKSIRRLSEEKSLKLCQTQQMK